MGAGDERKRLQYSLFNTVKVSLAECGESRLDYIIRKLRGENLGNNSIQTQFNWFAAPILLCPLGTL